MEFRTPQFIEIEDKIFGPLTFRQFIYLAGSGGLAYLIYSVAKSLGLPFLLAILSTAPALGLGALLAFFKVNNKPFIHLVEAAFKWLTKSKLYIWQKNTLVKKPSPKEEIEKNLPVDSNIPKLSDSKLRELSWGLDVLAMRKGNQDD